MLFRRVEDEAVLLDLRSGMYFGLNDAGARAWQLIVEHGALSLVLATLVDEYAVERDVVTRDLLALVEQLVARKLATLTPNAG